VRMPVASKVASTNRANIAEIPGTICQENAIVAPPHFLPSMKLADSKQSTDARILEVSSLF
jgi:hypothetical protein